MRFLVSARARQRVHSLYLLGCVALVSFVVACGGGGSAGSSGGSPATLAMGSVQFTITEPYTPIPSTSRSPQFSVPSTTQSLSIVLMQVNGSPPPSPASETTNLGSSAPGCTTTATTLTCQVTAQAPAGNDKFSVVTYSQPNESGNLLGAGALIVNVVAGQTAQAPATLTGTVTNIAVTVVGSVPEGMATTLPVQVVAKDSKGYTIIGTYANPITLADSDTSGSTTLSATSLSAAAGINLAYNGAQMSTPVSISASANGVPSTSITNASFLPLTTAPAVNAASLTYTESDTYTTETIGSPGPTPTPSISTYTYTTTFSTGATYNGTSGLVKAETVYPQPTGSPEIDDAYYQWAPGPAAGSWAFGFVGENYTAQQYTSTDVCSAPYSEQWVVPLPQSWDYFATTDGSCTFTDTSTSANPYVHAGTFFADGSGSSTYTFPVSTPYPTGSVLAFVQNSDGTLLITNNDASNGSSIVAVGTPAPGAATIPLEVQTFPGALPSPGTSGTPAPVATSEPNWYSTAGLPNGVVPSPLQSGVYTTVGSTSLPAQCPISASILGTSPTVSELDYLYTLLDPSGMYKTHTDRLFFVNGLGDVCDLYTDSEYDNWNEQEAGFPGVTYQPTTLSVTSGADYITTTSLTASMIATKSFAEALPAASQMLVLGSAAERERMQIQARSRAERLEAQRLLVLHHRFH